MRHWLLVGALVLTPVGEVYAGVTIPFTTTYDCVEQDQNDVGWPNCDGLGQAGSWTATNGGVEQITSSANYASGGGGRGQRHWISNGTNFLSGSIDVDIDNPSTELYVRWYVRFQSGLALGSSSSPHKILYFTGSTCTGRPGGCYFAISTVGARITMGTNYDNGDAWGWNDMMGGSNSADGQWHWFEIHVKRNSGAGDDVAQLWVDGTLRLDRNDVSFGGDTSGFTSFRLPENGAFVVSPTSIDMYEDIDDLAIQTTGPIGALGSGGGGGSSTGGSMDVKRRSHDLIFVRGR